MVQQYAHDKKSSMSLPEMETGRCDHINVSCAKSVANAVHALSAKTWYKVTLEKSGDEENDPKSSSLKVEKEFGSDVCTNVFMISVPALTCCYVLLCVGQTRSVEQCPMGC